MPADGDSIATAYQARIAQSFANSAKKRTRKLLHERFSSSTGMERFCSRMGLKHGHSRKGQTTRTYIAWAAMIARCTNPKGIGYKNYGGRGIAVCERWLHSFENFLADMDEKPTGLTL